MLGKEPHAIDMLSPIPYVLWVHGLGLTRLGHNQYTEIRSSEPYSTQAVGPEDLVRTVKR